MAKAKIPNDFSLFFLSLFVADSDTSDNILRKVEFKDCLSSYSKFSKNVPIVWLVAHTFVCKIVVCHPLKLVKLKVKLKLKSESETWIWN